MNRTSSWIVALASVLGTGALVAACSAVVSPDTSRLHPGGDGGTTPVDAQMPPPDGSSTCAAGCDDGIACTTDTCASAGPMGGSCQHAPDSAACPSDQRCNATLGCVPLRCTTDAECSNGNACDGIERCDPGSSTDATGCVTGTPMVCNDGYACTDDACDPATGACTSTPVDARCDDGIDCTMDACTPGGAGDGCSNVADDSLCNDGFCYTGGRCNATTGCTGSSPRNCDDGDACDVESCDPALMMCVSTPRDADMDGHAIARTTPFGGTACAGGDDCDDTRAEVHPGADEICGNGRDEDCDGMVDDGCGTTLNDTCATATPITIDPFSGTGSVTGTFAGYADDITAARCLGSGVTGGRDAAYYFDVTSLSDVVIDTTGSGSGQDTVLAVTFDCAADYVVCNDDQDREATITSRIFLHRVGPPTGSSSVRVYVWVDGYNGDATGAFRVNVRINPARADSCSTEPLDITGGGSVLGIGPYGAITGAQRGTCQDWGEAGEGEAVFRFATPSDGNIAELTARSTTFTPDLYLRASPCSSGWERDCVSGASVGGGVYRAQLGGITAPAGSTNFAFVDGMLGTTPSAAPHAYTLYYDP